MSSISAVSPATTAIAKPPAPAPAKAADGDSAAVEAAETSKTVQAEKLNGGYEPKAAPATPGGVNKLA